MLLLLYEDEAEAAQKRCMYQDLLRFKYYEQAKLHTILYIQLQVCVILLNII